MKFLKPTFLFALATSFFLTSCSTTVAPIIATDTTNIDTLPLKLNPLNEKELENWRFKDLAQDTVPGMSVDKAYNEIIKNNKGETVIVAIIDSGIDIEHEDLDAVIWTNPKEIPNNNIDDDKNGYVDDIHGWNFLGDAYDEQLEFIRLLASGDTSNPRYAEAQAKYEKEYNETAQTKQNIENLLQQAKSAKEILTKHFKKDNYTKEEVSAIKSEDETLNQAKSVQSFLYQRDLSIEDLEHYSESYADRLNYNYNKDFNGRKTGDNVNDINETGYGNGNVMPVKKSEAHGTHVAGIIAAERNNNIGTKGVANNVKIMSLRAVPNGDEYDKDIALAIRYAVDNGAKVINGSFGKSFSPHADWVYDAIKYAAKHDVLFVHAAGNDSENLDAGYQNFPNDQVNNGKEIADNMVTVGALAPKYGSEMVAGFSNYGKINVDVFAPGAKIYSTTPENEYKKFGGTSMASPAVAGIAAVIRSLYPTLSAKQVKYILLNSGLTSNSPVIVGGDENNVKKFTELSKSGKMANLYNALQMASKMK
ncbi:MAG: S8 family peptidase [Flavobacteriales bacterium]